MELHPFNFELGRVASLAHGMLTDVTLSTDMKYACTVGPLFVGLGQPLGQSGSEARGADLDPFRSLEPSPVQASVNQISASPSTDTQVRINSHCWEPLTHAVTLTE